MSIGDALGMASQLGPFNAINNSHARVSASEIAGMQYNNAKLGRDHDLVGSFKILKAEDGFIVRCAQDEGYKQKTYVANDIDEAFDKAKAHLVSEALK